MILNFYQNFNNILHTLYQIHFYFYFFILSTSKISPVPIRHRGLLYLPVFSLRTISTMPNAETASATICSTNSGLIATPRPDNRPIKPRHVDGWLSFKSSISLSIFIPFIKKSSIRAG